MSTEKTEKLALHRWVAEDLFLRTEFNENFTAIDRQFASVDDRLTTHAAQHGTGGGDPVAPADIGAASATHAAQHRTGGTDPITPASIGAVKKAGDTMTGSLTISAGGLDVLNGGLNVKNYPATIHTNGQEQLIIKRGSVNPSRMRFENTRGVLGYFGHNWDIDGGLFYWLSDGSTKYQILDTGSKPSGSYTGNGAARSVTVGGEGKVCMVWRSTTYCLVNEDGFVCIWSSEGLSSGSGGVDDAAKSITFVDGVLTFAASTVYPEGYTFMNEAGTTYNYQVL